jgi:hypothetical protein
MQKAADGSQQRHFAGSFDRGIESGNATHL